MDHFERRLWLRVSEQPSGCWEWQGALFPAGYGQITYQGKPMGVHRVVMILLGHDVEGVVVRHECDNPPCCRPDHLLLGTQKMNMEDAVKRNRMNNVKGAHHYKAKFSDAHVLYLRATYADPSNTLTIAELAKANDIDASALGKILRRQTWKHI
jgi:hypothetical protein